MAKGSGSKVVQRYMQSKERETRGVGLRLGDIEGFEFLLTSPLVSFPERKGRILSLKISNETWLGRYDEEEEDSIEL